MHTTRSIYRIIRRSYSIVHNNFNIKATQKYDRKINIRQLTNEATPDLMQHHKVTIESSSAAAATMADIRSKKKERDDERKKSDSNGGISIEGYKIEGISISGHETCVIFPTLNLAFDIGRCPSRAISQDFLFISHAHMDHIGGLPMYVATRGLYSMKPPTIFVPKAIVEHVQNLFDVHRAMDQSELKHTLVGLDVGEEYCIKENHLKVKAFKTYHVIPSQGYLVSSIRQKLKEEYVGRPGSELKELKKSGVEITNTVTSPEIAFTGDTMADFIVDSANSDVLKAKILVMECTFLDNTITVEHAREYGHTHLSEVIKYAEMFQNKAILMIHFSARYKVQDIEEAISKLSKTFPTKVYALTEGFPDGSSDPKAAAC